jgi:hypothetical protein
MRGLILLGLAVLLNGCATPMQTASGRPEVMIKGTPSQVRAGVINHFVDKGWQLRDGNELTILLVRDAGIVSDVFFGSQWDPRTIDQVRITFVPMEENVRVLGSLALVTNRGGAFQREHELNTLYQNLQVELQQVQFEMANKVVYGTGPLPVMKKE